MPGSRSDGTASSCAFVSMTAKGAQGTPQRRKWPFSSLRSWQIATASADGAVGRCAPSV